MTRPGTGTADDARRAFAGADGIIFDNDGVLVDSEPVSLAAYRDAIREQGVDLCEQDDEKYCGLTDADIVRDMEKVYGLELDLVRFQARKRELYFLYAGQRGLPAFPGARDLLGSLVAARRPIALASSAPTEKITHNLAAAGLGGLFRVVVTGEDFARGKPDPEIFLRAAERLGVGPGRCVVIEDSINGLRAARAAGMFGIGITNTFPAERLAPHADAVITSLDQLMPR